MPAYEHDAALLLDECSKGAPTAEQRATLGAAARMLLTRHLERDLDDSYLPWIAPLVIRGFIRTFDADPDAARPLLDRLLARERIERVGQHEIAYLCLELTQAHDARALELIYARLFADITLPAGNVTIGQPNVALNLFQDSRQILEVARGQLEQRFGGYLTEDPRRAIRSLCFVVAQTRWTKMHARPLRVRFAGTVHTVLMDGSNVWDSDIHRHDDWYKMSATLETHLRAELAAGRTDLFMTALEEITRHGPHLFLWRILVRTAGLTEATARAVLELIAQRDVPVALELHAPIATYLSTGYARLAADERERIDRAILAIEAEETNPRLRNARADLVTLYAGALPAGTASALAGRRPVAPPNSGRARTAASRLCF